MHPTHTYNLVLSMVVNGHVTNLTNVMEVTGCNILAIKEALPLLWDYARTCSMPEFIKLHALRKQVIATPLLISQEH
jgi:hypothetical protein